MKIIEERKKITTFSELEIGDTFQYYNIVFIKIEKLYDCNTNNYFNAIALRDGESNYFTNEKIEKVECVLTVK